MTGTKIINVLKDDTFKDILELFRHTDAEDVVFVLPKRSAVFKREDHFAAFASEAKRTDKKVSIMCANTDVNDWAHKYGFTVINKKSRTATGEKKSGPEATLAAGMSDDDEEVRDANTDAYDPDIPATSDESMGVTDKTEEAREEGVLAEDEGVEEEIEAAAEPSPVDGDEAEEDVLDEEEEDFEKTLQRYGGNDMDLYDAEGNLVFSGGRPVSATLAAARSLDAVRPSEGGTSVAVKGGSSRKMKVGVKSVPKTSAEAGEGDTDAENRSDGDGDELDYIDAVWRDTVGDEDEEAPANTKSRWRKLFTADPKEGRRSDRRGNRSNGKNGGKGKAILMTIIAVVALAGGAYLILGLGKANVEIVPVSRDLEFQISVQSSDAFGEVDPLFNKIPGQLFEIERTVEREFQASGEQEVAAKAKGTITVLNDFSAEPQTLIATTRFEDPDGKVFRTLQTVTVPGKSGDEPGSVEVDVIADKPGPEYNIEPSDFTIPAFQEQGLAGRFQGITGSSREAFVGGALGLSGIVTQEDVDAAIAQVTEELENEVRRAFEAQAVDLELINAAQVGVTDVETSAEVDQAVDSFTVSARGTLSTVGFRADDLFVLLEDHARRNWQLTVRPDQLELHYDEIRFVEDRGILAFSVTALGKGYVDLDTEQITSDIAGMSRDAVREYFRTAEGVRSSTVLLSPIWVRSVPDDPERIELELRYETPMEP